MKCKHCKLEIVPYGVSFVSTERVVGPRNCRANNGEAHEPEVEEYWGDPSGNLRRMSGEQEVIATVSPICTEQEWKALCSLQV